MVLTSMEIYVPYFALYLVDLVLKPVQVIIMEWVAKWLIHVLGNIADDFITSLKCRSIELELSLTQYSIRVMAFFPGVIYINKSYVKSARNAQCTLCLHSQSVL